jgi:hypothetical protein
VAKEQFTENEWEMIKAGLRLMVLNHKNNADNSSEEGKQMYLHAGNKFNELLEKITKFHPYIWIPNNDNELEFKREYECKWVGEK